MYHCTYPMFLLVDTSDFPSVVEQLQQGHDSSCYTLLAVIPSSMKCLMPYACQLASSSMGISYYASCSCSYILTFSVSFSSITPTPINPPSQLGLCSPFYPGCFLIEPWDSLSDCAPRDSMSGFPRPLIGQVHSGVVCLVL